MQEFLLIIISLVLGFIQGLKKRNKKHNIKIKELEMQITTLNDELINTKRKIRLEQYNNGSLKKKNKDRFETDYTSFVTESLDNYILCANTYGILNMVFKTNSKTNQNYLEQEFVLEQIINDIENYLEESEYHDDNIDIIVEYQNGIKKFVDPYDAYNSFKEWIDKFNIDIYAISKGELLETMNFILYEMTFDN